VRSFKPRNWELSSQPCNQAAPISQHDHQKSYFQTFQSKKEKKTEKNPTIRKFSKKKMFKPYHREEQEKPTVKKDEIKKLEDQPCHQEESSGQP